MRLSFLILFISLAFSCLAQQLKIDKSTQPQIGDQFSFQESNLSLADYRDIHNKKIWDFDILKKSGITNSKIIENFSSEMEGDFLLEIGGVVKYGLKQNRKSLDIVSFKDQAGLSESLNVVFDCIEPELFRPNSIYKGLRDRSESKCIAEITKNQLPPNLKDFLSPEISSTRVVRTTKHIFKADKQLRSKVLCLLLLLLEKKMIWSG